MFGKSRELFISVLLILLVASLLTANAQQYELDNFEKILDKADVMGGFIVHIGCGDGKLTAAMRVNDSFMVHGLDVDAGNVKKARDNIKSMGLYGTVTVDQLKGSQLPYVDNLVNLVVSDDLGDVSMDEVMRVLCPDGVAYVKMDGKWVKKVKPVPEEIDEWTHYLYDCTNSAVSHDTVVGPPQRMQWVGSPRWSRHHDRMSSFSACVSANGRIFYIIDEGSRASIMLPAKWAIVARDAFNGTVLWKKPIPDWHPQLWPLKSGPGQLPRRLVAVGDVVYATLGYYAPLSALSASSGEVIRTYEGTKTTEEVIFSDGVLFMMTNKTPINWKGLSQEFNKRRGQWPWDDHARNLMAVKADSGEVIWEKETKMIPLTLTADEKGVYYHDGDSIIRLSRKDGSEIWTSEPVTRREKIQSNFGPTLIVYKNVVLFAGGNQSNLVALSADDGKIIWEDKHDNNSYMCPHDLFVLDGMVWSSAAATPNPVFTAWDPKTGEVKKKIDPGLNINWHHQRCYRSKATDRFFIPSRTGIEFVDTQRDWGLTNHWVRGACLYGVMPANGYVYSTPHNCACYQESKLYGLCALASDHKDTDYPKAMSDEERLEKGSAYGKPVDDAEGEEDWSTYRCDNMRSGNAKSKIPEKLNTAWKSELAGKLSPVVVSGDKLFVAETDKHTVHALDAKTGKPIWSYTTGGRVDSPPTIYKGRALFGSADGWVYCLKADDGELIWRFQAAPMDMRIMAFEQLESLWPVHGSVLIQDDKVYCVSGRSMFLDGGLRFLQLDPVTGEKLMEKVMDDKDPETGKNLQALGKNLQMPVGLPDIMSSDGKYIYMKSQRFTMDGKRQKIEPNSGDTQEQASDDFQYGEGTHLFCPTGFLDDSWMHRTYWIWGKAWSSGWDGYFEAGRYTPSGRIMVFDEENVYGYGRKQEYYKWTTPLEHHLFSISKAPEIVIKKLMPGQSRRAVERAKLIHTWSKDIPLFVRSMVMSDGKIFIAGPPDMVDEHEAMKLFNESEMQKKLKEQDEAFDGMNGALIWVVSVPDGEKIAEYKLDSSPVWDSMAAANGCLYLSTVDGKVLCMSGE
jgi:outer membrane protein assembly factor BamB